MGSKPKAQTVGFRYSFDIHFGIAKAINGLLQIRAAGKTAWKGNATSTQSIRISVPNLFGGDKGEGGIDGTLDLMMGDENQPVNQRLASALGGKLVPAFRGFAGAFYSGLITSLNPYPKPWELQVWRTNGGWDGSVWYPETCQINLSSAQIRAMNPAHILYETYTNREWGRGLDRSMMDDAAFRKAALALYNEGFGLCLAYQRSTPLAEFRDQICDHIGAYVGPDRRSGLITITLVRDDYDPDTVPLFDENNGLLSIDDDEIASAMSAPSQLLVEYIDAVSGESRRARAVNSAIAMLQGGPSVEVVNYPGIPTAELAGRVAARDMRIKSSDLRKFTVRLDRRGWKLAPGSVFRVRSLRRGIETIVLRVGKIEDGTQSSGAITVTALQDVFGLPSSNFIAVPPSGYVPPDRTPQAIVLRRIAEVPYRELVGVIDPANLALLDPTSAWLFALAARPTGLSMSYDITTRPGTSGSFVNRGTADWCPTAQIVEALTPGESRAVITAGIDLDSVTVGQAALLDDEIVRVDAFDLTTGAITLGRGCVDTVPASHAAGARIWFYDGFEGVDEVEYSSGVTLQAQLLTNTSEGQLLPAQAGTDSLRLVGRQGLPYPPGQFQVNGSASPSEIYGQLVVSWAQRDRLAQADQLIDTAVGNIGPESGTRATLMLYSGTTLKRTYAGISSNSWTYPIADDVADGVLQNIRIVLRNVRDGLNSWQQHDITIERHGLGFRLGEELGGVAK